jgi:hypothetical protein
VSSPLNELAKRGLSELGNKDVTRNAALAAPIEAPSIPEFAKPQKDPKVTDLFKEIKSLDGLKAYAQAAAWEKNKKAGNTEGLQDFLKKADDKNDVSGVPDDDTASPLIPTDDSSVRHLRARPPLAEPPKATDVSKYEPLGVWIVDWARLFPWLVTGHDNAVTKGVKALDWIRLKTLHQDCLSLTRLYDRLEGEGCKVLVNDKPVDFRGIRDSFSHVAEGVAEFLTRRAVKDVSDKIRSFISEMSADARNIYATWDEFPQFRRCQLGAGVIFELGPNTTVCDLKIQGSGIEIQQETCAFQLPDYSAFARYGKAWPFIIPDGHILAFVSVGSASTSGILSFRRHVINRINGSPSFSDTFSLNKQAACPTQLGADASWTAKETDPWVNAYMALPFFESSGGFVREPGNRERRNPQSFQRAPDLYVVVLSQGKTPDGIVFGYQTYIRLYPIPFDAARGISDWKGCAMTTGMGTLGKDLKAIKDELSQLNR